MGFRINTNVSALNAHAIITYNNRELSQSLNRLSTGLRITQAADDASGMQIADSLRNQANALEQALKNSHDALGIVQIADKAMEEQIKIVDSVKVKATQAAQDGQTSETRKAIQADINRLLEGLDNIAATTSFNGQALLSGSFTNKEFQIGAYSNSTVKTSILATSSDKIGHVRFERWNTFSMSTDIAMQFGKVDGKNDVRLEWVTISHSAGTGFGVLAEVINKNSDLLNAKASWSNMITGTSAIQAGTVENLVINDITIGNVTDVKSMDSDGKLLAAFNKVREQTGIEATLDVKGRLNLRSLDGRGIKVDAGSIGNVMRITASGGDTSVESYGSIEFVRLDARDIIISALATFTAGAWTYSHTEATVNLRSLRGTFSAQESTAMGAYANEVLSAEAGEGIGAGVTSLKGAMATMDIADAAQKTLNKIRADLGAAGTQLVSSIQNITSMIANVRSADSTIREADFAAESANFSRLSILAQSGSFALSQTNSVQQNILRLLQ